MSSLGSGYPTMSSLPLTDATLTELLRGHDTDESEREASSRSSAVTMEDVDMALNSVAAAAGGEEVLAHLLDFLMQSDPGHGTNDQRRAQAQAVVAQYPDAPAHYAAAPHISQLNLLQPQQPGLLQRTSTGSRSQPGVLPLPLPCTSTSTPSDGSQGYGGDRDSLSSMSSSTFSPSPVRHGGSRTSPSYLAANVGHIRSPANRSTAATAVYSRSDPPLFKNEAGLMGNTLPAFSSSTGEYDFSASVACAANNYTPANSHAAACAYARPELAGAGHMGPSASGPLLSTFESGLSDMFPSLFPLDADTSLEANLAHAAYTGMLAPSSYSSTPVMDDDEALVCFSEPLPPPPPADACAPYPCRSGYAPASVSAAAAPFRPTSTASAEYADRYSDYRAWSPPRGIVKRSSVPSSLGKERAAAMRASSEKRGTINRARARSEAASVHRVANANPPKRRKSSGDRPDGGCQCCHLNDTPMWREGPNKMRVCNACGIRWQKYGYYCRTCKIIPTKKQGTSGKCPSCKDTLPEPAPTDTTYHSKHKNKHMHT